MRTPPIEGRAPALLSAKIIPFPPGLPRLSGIVPLPAEYLAMLCRTCFQGEAGLPRMNTAEAALYLSRELRRQRVIPMSARIPEADVANSYAWMVDTFHRHQALGLLGAEA